MKSKQEILDHLSKTVYTHNARKSIIQWMLQHHVVDYKCQIKFAKHVYNRDGVRMTEGCSFKDFDDWLGGYEIEKIEKLTNKMLDEYLRGINRECVYGIDTPIAVMTGKSAKELADAWAECIENINKGWHVACNKIIAEDFKIGDAVKYMPTPDESSTEYIEAIAHGTDGEKYLCLSNGEWVKPCYCVKYKYQGDERRALIDKLNEVL